MRLLLVLMAMGLVEAAASEPDMVNFHHMDASQCPAAKSVKVVVRPEMTTITLLLTESSRDFISPDAVAHDRFFNLRRRPCFYQGGNPDEPGDNSAVAKQVLGWFSATFSYNGAIFEIAPQPADRPQFDAHRIPPAPFQYRCGLSHTDEHSDGHPGSRSARLRRAISGGGKLDLHSPVDEGRQTYILLVLIGDEPFVNGTGGDVIMATERLWEIGNYVNNLYKPHGVNVVTVRAQTLTGDPLNLGNNASGTVPETMLTNFMNYRMQFLTDIVHSAAHLVSGLRMTGANVGLANYGKLCQFAFGGGVNSDMAMNGSAFSVAVTVAHELGHNLGMEHDPEVPGPCGCTDPQGCIMTAVGTEVNPVRFSNCSIEKYKEFSVSNGLGYCMVRPPTLAVLADVAPKCGNRVLDAGEDCDCGKPDYCNNSCCNPATCKFRAGATCASGQCCNTTTCSVMSRGSVCRASRGICDLPEYCNGTYEWCPDVDDHKIDGTACAYDPSNATKVLAYCHQASCVTRDARCKELFTAPDFRAAPDTTAVKTMDDSGLGEGYCSYRPASYSPLKYTFTPCTSQSQRCGTLYCVGTMPDGFPTPKWKGLAISDARTIVPASTSESVLAYARNDYRLSGYRDPGLVPDGAECGSGMMCVNSECVSVAFVRSNATVLAGVGSLPNCSGRGDVTRTGLCFCSYGFRPPNCIETGYGGSLTNLPAESGEITTSTTSTTTPTTQTTRLEFTTLEQKHDNFWTFVGIGIGIGVAVILAILFFVWLYYWCRRNDTGPYIGGLDVAVTDASAAVKFRSSGDIRSYPLAEASPDQVMVAAVGFTNGRGGRSHVERHYAANSYFDGNGEGDYDNDAMYMSVSGKASKYEVELEVGVPGSFVKKA